MGLVGQASSMPRRWWLFRAFDLVARAWPVRGRPRGLLIVRIDGIGDIVLFHAAYAHYARVFAVDPAEITLLGCASWASLARDLFPGCRFRAIDEHRFDRNPFYRFAVSLWVRRQNFAIATCDIFMRKPLVADSLIDVSGAPRTIVAKPYLSHKTQRLFDWYLGRVSQVIDTGPYPTHEIVRHFRFLSMLAGREIAPQAPVLPWRGSGRAPLAEPYVVINLGGNEPGRRWASERFIALSRTLAACGLKIVFVGGGADKSLKPLLPDSMSGGTFVDLIGGTTLPQLLDLLRHAALAVSSDTGPAHLAAALGTPTVVIVGGGHFTSFVPYPAAVTPPRTRFVYRELACFHCFWNCTEPHEKGRSFPCLDAVGEAEVLASIDELLALPGAATAAAP